MPVVSSLRHLFATPRLYTSLGMVSNNKTLEQKHVHQHEKLELLDVGGGV